MFWANFLPRGDFLGFWRFGFWFGLRLLGTGICGFVILGLLFFEILVFLGLDFDVGLV